MDRALLPLACPRCGEKFDCAAGRRSAPGGL